MLDKIELIQTCGGCPEQYDAYMGDTYVGELRLRHGNFTVECGTETVYSAKPEGDGIFDWEEREYYLNEAKYAILKHLQLT